MAGSTAARQKSQQLGVLDEFCQAVAEDLSALAVLHHEEPAAELLNALRQEGFPEGLGLQLQGEQGIQAADLMTRALSVLPEQLDQDILNELAADYASIYLNHGLQASPEESVWVDEENLAYQDSMFQVRDWYAKYGLGVEDWRIRPDDHLVLQLQFIAHLLSSEVSDTRLKEVAQFMDEHLLRWAMQFAERVAARCATPYFAGVCMLTASYCEELRDLIAEILDEPRPTAEEIEERMKPRHEPEPVPVKFMPGMGPAV